MSPVRTAAGLALLVGAMVFAAGLFVERELARAEERSAAATAAAAEDAAATAERELARVAGAVAAGPSPSDRARAAGLDLLVITDREGVVRESIHWPEQRGLPAVGFGALADRATAVLDVPGPTGVTRYRVSRTDTDSGRIYAGRELRAASPGGETDPLRARLRRGLIGLGVVFVAGACGAGVLIGRRAAVPLDRLARAVDRVSAGMEDYDFDTGDRSAADGPRVAVSRLRRAFDRERARAAQAGRVAAWREIARHVAHEVKNPLAPIRLTVENLERAKRTRPELFDELFDAGARTILEEVEQLRRLVGEFAEFARLPPPRRETVDLHALVSAVAELYAAEPGLELSLTEEDAVGPVEADPDQLRRALGNVVGNAVEALRETDGARRVRIAVGGDGAEAWIRVEDNGPGMPDDVRDHVFRPYFTTKEGGTGLGMAITHRIVSEHGGLIRVEPASGGGSVVELRIPTRGHQGDVE